ncbi:MAG: GNAT family N-acetyltransferase [Methylibium sp.]
MTRISGHARRLLGRTERRIAEHGPLAYGWAETREDRLQILDTLIAQKAQQLVEMGVKNTFDGGVTAFYRAIALLEGNNPRRLRLGYLEVGDEVLATHSGTICHNRLMITLSSRTDGQLKRYSPGPLLLRHQIEEAATQGLAFYDLGLGTASYKEKWCDVVEPLFDCCVAFKPHGALLTLALNSGARAKRFVKSNPRVL